MPARKNLVPSIQVGDKVVQVGSLDWAAFKALVDAFAKADLPLPNLATDQLRSKLHAVQATASVDGSINMADIIGLAIEFVSSNLPTITTWISKHPPLIDALLAGATNLVPDEVARLSAGEVLRVARAAFRELVDDGVFSEAAGFFAELLGLRPGTSAPADRATGISAAESTAESATA